MFPASKDIIQLPSVAKTKRAQKTPYDVFCNSAVLTNGTLAPFKGLCEQGKYASR